MSKKTQAALLADHLAACEQRSADLQNALIAAQEAVAHSVPTFRNPSEAARLLADARANDAVRGTTDAVALAEQFETERKAAEKASAAHAKLEAEARRIADNLAQAHADTQAARDAFERIVKAEASKTADEARRQYGAALQSLIDAHELLLVAHVAQHGGNLPAGYLLPSLPAFGQPIKAALATVTQDRVFFGDGLFRESVVHQRAAEFRAAIVKGGK